MARKKAKKPGEANEFRAKKREKLRFLAEMEPRKMIIYPLAVFIVALLLLAVHFPPLGIDLKGGVVVTGYGINANPDQVEKWLSSELGVNVNVESFTSVEGTKGIRVYAPAGVDPVKIINLLKQKYPNAEYTHSEVLPTFGELAKKQGIKAIAFAFLAMAVVVFLFFRNPVSSLAIIFSALSDMTIAVAMMGVFGIQLTTATIAALLMLIGYTVDSNILLTTKLTRRKEDTIEEAYLSAVSTGFTMSTTTLGALFMLWLISTSPTIDNIAIVLIFGLLADFMNTWIFNAGVLRWYLSTRGVKA
ncbi:protein translocase subunit SecF [Thermococcus nautili]|uniref:Protein-export membrane protein SecF n=1 Tax=Thermococcus nautili TaxID=195522 RepID=W8NUZ9_9EURY|nr:protein translocase subunit SecF [Thermococcus nautili]AHL23002.1 Preprotein translocase subunit SecF [Thermococcus nautili]